MKLRIRYNAPAVLSFSIIATIILIVDSLIPLELQLMFFSVGPDMSLRSIVDWMRLFTHVLGHANIDHLFGNLAFILLLGPILEEKNGTATMLLMIGSTALITGIAHILLSDSTLLGSSAIVFMMILLSSYTNVKRHEIPLSFILVVVLYLIREIFAAFSADSISQLSHILGGAVGSTIGSIQAYRRKS